MFFFWFQRIVVREKKHRHKLQPNGKSDYHPLIIHPLRCTSCDNLGVYVNPMGKKCFLVPLATVHPSWCICGSCVRCGPNGKVFLSTEHPSDHPSIHPSKPSILHTLQLWQLVHSQTDYPVPCGGCEPNGKVFCVHPPSIPHGFFWLFVFVIFRPQSTSTHQCTREGWMVSGHETVFCWVSVPLLTMVVNSVASF
jgi:hypothetical protein